MVSHWLQSSWCYRIQPDLSSTQLQPVQLVLSVPGPLHSVIYFLWCSHQVFWPPHSTARLVQMACVRSLQLGPPYSCKLQSNVWLYIFFRDCKWMVSQVVFPGFNRSISVPQKKSKKAGLHPEPLIAGKIPLALINCATILPVIEF